MAIAGFDGASTIRDTRNVSGLDVGLQQPPFSFACWMYLTSYSATIDFTGLGINTNTRSTGIHYRLANDELSCLHWNGTASVFTPLTVNGLTANKWIACVISLGQDPAGGITAGWVNSKKIYSTNDGTIRKTTTTENMANATMNRFSIGGSPHSTTPTNVGPTGMLIAEVAVWNSLLEDNEILAYGKGIKPSQIKPENLQIYFPGIRNIQNEIVNNLPTTLTGNLTAGDHTRRYG